MFATIGILYECIIVYPYNIYVTLFSSFGIHLIYEYTWLHIDLHLLCYLIPMLLPIL